MQDYGQLQDFSQCGTEICKRNLLHLHDMAKYLTPHDARITCTGCGRIVDAAQSRGARPTAHGLCAARRDTARGLFCEFRETVESGVSTSHQKPTMPAFTAPDTSRLDCKADQAAALCAALVELTRTAVPDLHIVRGLLHTMQDVLQDVQAIAQQVEFECTVVPAAMA